MRILMTGAGATGGYFGARLAQAGRDITFLVRPGRAEQIRRDGLRIISPHGNLTLSPRLLTRDQISEPFNLIILAVKAYALDQAIQDLASAVGPDTVIVPLLNGMRHIDALVARFGQIPVLGGVCIVATTLDADGRIVQLNEMQDLAYGERDGTITPRVQAVDAALQGAGFGARLSETISQDMWEKWVMLAATGALTCLLRGTVGEIEAVPGGSALALRVLDEASAVASASGYAPREPFMNRARMMLTAKGSGFASSMYRDLTLNAPVEVDHIIGDLSDRARALGVPTPLLQAAVAQLRIYQNRLRVAA